MTTLTAATSGSNPDIIIKHQFSVAKSYYVDYMLDHNGKDKSLTDLQNDYDIVKTQLAKKKGEFNDYLEYGARDDVTQLEDEVDDKLTTTFTQDSFNISTTELRELQRHVDVAAENKNLMWKTVVSFSDDFLIRENIMDNAEERHLDQRKIKEVIQKSMPDMLKAEGIDESAEWFANIHLHGDQNKNHIHVHIGTFEQQSNRPDKFNPATKRIEPKGLFKQRTINHLKSKIWRNMRQEKNITKEKELMVERDIATKKMLQSMDDVGYKIKQKKLINSLMQVLPDEKEQKWRFGSNAVSMKAANSLAQRFVENILEEDPELIDRFNSSTAELDEQYQKAFGNNDHEYQDNQQELLKERLVNRLYQNLRNLNPEFLEIQPTNEMDGNSLSDKTQIKETLEQQVKEMKRKKQVVPKNVTRELGKVKRDIRNDNLTKKRADIRRQIDYMKEFNDDENLLLFDKYIDDPLITYRQNSLIEQDDLVGLQLTPNFKLTEEEKQRKQNLQLKHATASQVKIDEVTDEFFEMYVEEKNKEINLINLSEVDSFQIAYGQADSSEIPKEAIINKINRDVELVTVKHKVNRNNQLINDGVENQKEIKKQNAQLLGEISELEGRENTFQENQNKSKKINDERNDDKKNKKESLRKPKIKLNLSGLEHVLSDMNYSVDHADDVERQAKMAYEREQQKLNRDM